MNIVVSILNWNGFENTLRCLESLCLINSASHNLTVCVSDNNSFEFDQQKIKKRFPDIRIFINQENIGYAAGHSKALSFAQSIKAELFWLLNNDTLVENNTLERLIAAYQHYGMGLYGSASKLSNGDAKPEVVWSINESDVKKSSFKPMSQSLLNDGQTYQVSNVVGYSLLIPIQLIKRHGFMHHSYFLYYEETDYCLRLLQQAIPSFWVGSSHVFHEGQASSKGCGALEEVMDYYLYRNLFLLLKKHASMSVLVHFLTRFVMRFLSANVLRKKKVPPLTKKHLMALLHAFLGVKGKYYKPEEYVRR